MTKKLGRNDPCWCGSGRKYKHCHLGRSREPRLAREEMRRLVEARTKIRECLHPEASPAHCEGGIVRAHTIQRSGGISRIARDGHVMEFKRDLMAMFRHQGFIRPELVGVNRASTFTGFCARHDAETFRPIEANPLRACQEHAFLLAYRTLCRELYWKDKYVDSLPVMRTFDRGLPHDRQVALQGHFSLAEMGAKQALGVLRRHKSMYDAALMSRDYSQARYYVIWVDSVPDVVYAGGWFPAVGFDGKAITSASDSFFREGRLWGLMTACLIPVDEGGAAVFAWLGDSEACMEFIRSLEGLDDALVPDALVRYGFATVENLYMSPVWWEGLSESTQHALCERFNAGANIGDAPNSLTPDGRTYVEWSVSGRETSAHHTHPPRQP